MPAPKSLPTQKTIAEACNLSRSTVATILGGGARSALFSAEIRQKVLETAERLNYRPNRAAQIMSKGRSNLIAVIYYGAGYHAGRRAANSLPQALDSRGYDFLIFDFQWHGKYIDGILREIIEHRVEGVILLGLPADTFTGEHTNILRSNRIPVVALDCDAELPDISSCYCNSQPAIAELTRHLLQLGHKTLLQVIFGNKNSPEIPRSRKERIDGFREALSGAGVCQIYSETEFFQYWHGEQSASKGAIQGLVVFLPVPNPGGEQSARRTLYEFGKRLFIDKKLPEAIVCPNDESAMGIFSAALEFDVKIPRDLAITGYDDDEQGRYPYFSLTTARKEVNQGCEAAVQLLMEQIQTKDFSKKVKMFSPTLMLRNSCGRKSGIETSIETLQS